MNDPDGYGDVVLQRHYDPDELHVVEAAPRTLISGEMLDDIALGASPYASLDGNVLTIRATNRTVVYRIVGHHPDRLNRPDVYVAEWPD